MRAGKGETCMRCAPSRPSLLLTLAACVVTLTAGDVSCTSAPPPFGQLRVRVDTDAPIPSVVSRLRLDVFANGRWVDARDVSIRDRSEWPASFTVYAGEGPGTSNVRVRLRAYQEGGLRDYRGQRFIPPPPPDVSPEAMPAEPPPTDVPRLVKDGVDVTPRDEPLPGLAIDRLVGATLHDGEIIDAFVKLRIACAGTMVDLDGDRTCTETRNALVRTPSAANDDANAPDAWKAELDADFARLPPARDDEATIRGGVLVLGSRELAVRISVDATVGATPERIFVVRPLLVDREEVTVGKFRQAIAKGFVAPAPVVNDEAGFAIAGSENRRACTWSTAPLAGSDSRENYPLTCVSFDTARAFCKFQGGDLPTEAEYEWVATASGRAQKTTFPWGNTLPTCADVVFGRTVTGTTITTPCEGSPVPLGPTPVGAGALDNTPDGVHGLAGNVTEIMRDTYAPYAAACWARAGLLDPSCEGASANVVIRGFGWTSEAVGPGATRAPVSRGMYAYDAGFRCVRH